MAMQEQISISFGFGISRRNLKELMEIRGTEGMERLAECGGIKGICQKLITSAETGLSGSKEDLELRRKVYGANIIPLKHANKVMFEGQNCSIIRKGKDQDIPITEIVVGDICKIKYGDLLPADGFLLENSDLKIDESELSGESEFVKKSEKADLMIYAGTRVMGGFGKYVIVAVGINCQANVTGATVFDD